LFKEKNMILKSELEKLINIYSTDGKIKKEIETEFIKRNMLGSKGTQLFNGNKSLAMLSDENNLDLIDLFIFSFAFYNALKELSEEFPNSTKYVVDYEKINVNNYFTKIEVEEWTTYKAETVEISRYPYILPNMLQVAPRHWVGIISAKQLNEMYIGNDVLYNFMNQRDPKINVLGMKEINLDKTKVSEIEKNLLDGTQFPDEIKINVLKDGEDDVDLSSKNGLYGDLIIKSGTMNIFDGYHRFVSNSLAILKNPNMDYNWKIAITNMSETKARSFMVQINKQKAIKQEHVENMNPNKAENVVIDFIKDIYGDFPDMIVDTNELIYEKDHKTKKSFKGLTKTSILAVAIKECFNQELEIKSNTKLIANHISNVINYIIGLNLEKFTTSKHPIMTSKNIFIGYIALSEKTYNNDDWKEEVKTTLNNIDFSETNQLWKDIGLLNPKDATKPLREKLYKIFKS